jgi:hypothetical protein
METALAWEKELAMATVKPPVLVRVTAKATGMVMAKLLVMARALGYP